jgi:hypothetical protein
MPQIHETKAKAKESQRKWVFDDIQEKPAQIEQPKIVKEEEKV